MPHRHLPDSPAERDDQPLAERSTPWFYAATLEHRGVVVIVVSGDLDFATAPDLDDLLREADPARALVIDLTDCAFIDSSGLQVLACHRDRTRPLALCSAANDAAGRLLEITRALDRDNDPRDGLLVFASRDAALEALSPAPNGGSRP